MHAVTEPHTRTRRFPLGRSIAMLVGGAVAIGGAAAGVLTAFDAAGQLPIAIASGAACLLAATIAIVIMGRMAAAGDERIVQGAIIGMMVRLFGSMAGVALLVAALQFDLRQTMWWTIGWYTAFLGGEVAIMVRFLGTSLIPPNGDANGNSAENVAC
jgi:hypothetical protein